MDTILRNARIDDEQFDELTDIGIEEGRIAAIAPNLSAAGQEFDLGGRLVSSGFIESHIHLDKSRILDRCKSERGDLDEAIEEVAKAKKEFTPDDVYVTYGDTMSTPYSCGTLGSRGASYTISAAVMAARALRPKMCKIAAHLLELPEDVPDREDFRFELGHAVWVSDDSKRVSICKIVHTAIQAPINLPEGMEAGLDHTSYFEAPSTGMHSCSVHVCTVEVFPDTGQFKVLRYVVVDDSGNPINPMLVRGQINGGVGMGIGNATMEEYIYNLNGRQLTTNLRDYSMPSALDLPYVSVVHHNSPSPRTPLGSKGKGEGVPGTSSACLINAIENALIQLDVEIKSLPMRPENIWRLIQEQAGGR